MGAERILDALDPEQRAVAEAVSGPVCVLAGAGTGKTRAITHRIAYGVATGAFTAPQVLAVTFTTRAAGEMRSRLRALGAGGVQTRTFHAAALRQLRYFWPTAIGGEMPRIEASKAPLVAAAASRLGVRPGQAEVRDLAAEIEWSKVCQIAPADYVRAVAAGSRTPPAGLTPARMAELYGLYEDVKRARSVIDMEDILLLTVGMLADPDIAEKVHRQYRTFVVDEYQDVSPLQQRLLELWLGEREDLCVVGDPAQTIYSFAGATPAHLLGFARRHRGAQILRLVRNYRSTPQIVAVANAVLAGAGPGGAPPLALAAQRPTGPVPIVREHPDEETEAASVAASIAGSLDAGTPASAIAVLFRTNGQSAAYEQALAAAGVPYLLRGGEKFFERPEIMAARTLLRGAARSGDLGNDADASLATDLPGQVRDVLAGAGMAVAGPVSAGAAGERAASLAALAGIAEELARVDPAAGLSDLVAELDSRAADAHVPVVEGVTLASMHAAKGLEWDEVYLVGLVEGMVPISYAETPAAVEEERRLFYVGLTRAKDRLSLSWATARGSGGRGSRRPSRFLDGLHAPGSPPAARPPARARAKNRAALTCRICQATLIDAVARKLGRCEDCPADYDEALLERLRSWRLARSREASLPAYCVFTDATLQAIAEATPVALPELSRIAGVGSAKLERYGPDVIAICSGASDGSADT
ncbi:MAG: ATP-dependent DNA helicase UvrD2 [Sporichthyaceae bacterium]